MFGAKKGAVFDERYTLLKHGVESNMLCSCVAINISKILSVEKPNQCLLIGSYHVIAAKLLQGKNIFELQTGSVYHQCDPGS